MISNYFSGFVLLSIIAFLSGCVAMPTTGPSTSETNQSGLIKEEEAGVYRLKPLDPIFIRFSGIIEQQVLELVIDENGEINLLHTSTPTKAAGLTTSELEDKIERLYIDGEIYKNVSVNVMMTDKVYYVQGEANQPGQFQLASGTTLLQAIASARGYTPYANKRKVTITRRGKVYPYNLKVLEKDPSQDVKIEAGDVIKIWEKWY